MKEQEKIPDKSNQPQMLAEFEFDSSRGLAPFEDKCAILLDEFGSGSPTMLEEFEQSNEIIYLDEIFGSNTKKIDQKFDGLIF